ncbi:MAG: hypothetical protein DCF20_08665 [Pseudanabaena sp.]|nr:MAG: hypothetical protein DCF20_08665 [Pseudanabaena sp.]
MSSPFKIPAQIKKSLRSLVYTYRRKWLPVLLACLFVLFSFFPIPFPQVFFSATSNKVLSPSFIEPVNAQATPALCATPGRDGVGTPAGVINTYYPGTATVAAGATSIPVGASVGAPTNIAAGDLLLIIQMQDAVINSTNTDAYGNGVGGDVPPLLAPPAPQPPTNGASGFISSTAGRYEYIVATGPISAGAVPIRGANGSGLINTYFSAAATATQGQQTYQVVRVPQYSTSTLGSATSPFWNGSTGGIVVYDVAGNLNLNGGAIDVSGRGFRGGGGRQLGGAVSPNTDYRTLSTLAKNGSKGEGIAGTPRFVINPTTLALFDNTIEGYPNGSYGRGAPGNAGGGSTDGNTNSNDQNTGGGGGSNGGFGGIGGRAWFSDLPTGGFGGAPVPAATNILVLGGGGGAGTTNDGSGAGVVPNGAGIFSSGASGGGLVMLRTNTVSGVGTISANGTSARSVTQDGGGGGGAGGSVLVSALSNNLTGLTVNVNGGNGGDAIFAQPHGPGGGGGGGVVVASPGVTINSSGGAAGFTGIPPNLNNGALAGSGFAIPIAPTAIPGVGSGASCSAPRLVLSKRITNMTRGGVTITPSGSQDFNVFNEDGIANNGDNDPLWPDRNTYLRGAVNVSSSESGDVIEYTIYFLSSGNIPVTNATICDLIPSPTVFVSNAFDTVGGGTDLGIAFANSTTSLPTAPTSFLTNIIDADRGNFSPPNSLPPNTCRRSDGGNLSAVDNTDGVVVVNLVASPASLPFATASGIPPASYGFVRFQVRVK